jgi:hypothetical protein
VGSVLSAFSGLPVPDSAASNDVPFWLSQLVAVMDDALILTATSTTDRDSRYFNAPSGVICVVRGASSPFAITGVYVKTSDVGTATWSAIWSAPAPASPVPIPLADGFQTTNGKPPVAVYSAPSNTWTLWGNIAQINSGNIISGTQIGSLPAAVALNATIQPYYEGISTSSMTGSGWPSGAVKISIAASGTITVGMAGNIQVSWVGLDGIVLPGA